MDEVFPFTFSIFDILCRSFVIIDQFFNDQIKVKLNSVTKLLHLEFK